METEELKKQWTEALRSDKFKQGRGFLKKEDDDGVICHCCLGVLAEVAGEEFVEGMCPVYDEDTGEVVKEQKKFGIRDVRYDMAPNYLTLTLPLREKIGITQDQMDVLTGMNDENRDSFAKIADYIEENL